MSKKKQIDSTNLDDVTKGMHQRSTRRHKGQVGRGIHNERLVETFNKFFDTEEEKVYANGNAYIVLGGRDRPGLPQGPGHGSRGHRKSSKIDLVVGRHSSSENSDDPDVLVQPNFFNDAARIYICQKTEIDQHFGIDTGEDLGLINRIFKGGKNRSGIGIKADAVRLIGRENVKIVSGKASGVKTNGKKGELNSQGGEIDYSGGIDLIAGNNISTLQPIALGDNTVDAIKRLTEIIEEIQSSLLNFARQQGQINNALASHFHVSPFGGAPTSPSPSLTPIALSKQAKIFSTVTLPTIAIKYNLMFYRLTYLKKFSKKWICSRNCRAN